MTEEQQDLPFEEPETETPTVLPVDEEGFEIDDKDDLLEDDEDEYEDEDEDELTDKDSLDE